MEQFWRTRATKRLAFGKNTNCSTKYLSKLQLLKSREDKIFWIIFGLITWSVWINRLGESIVRVGVRMDSMSSKRAMFGPEKSGQQFQLLYDFGKSHNGEDWYQEIDDPECSLPRKQPHNKRTSWRWQTVKFRTDLRATSLIFSWIEWNEYWLDHLIL